MNCEKCKSGEMKQTKVFKYSGCLVVLGFCFMLPALFGLLVTALLWIGGIIGGTAMMAAAPTGEIKSNAVYQLNLISSLPPGFIQVFETNESEARLAADGLPLETKTQAQRIFSYYEAQKVLATKDAAKPVAALGMLGGIMTVGVFFVCIPILIVGFFLIMRKKVWRCSSCGTIFDRA